MNEIHKIIQNLLFNVEDPIIFEIGARQGEDTQILASNFPDGDIYAFEPLCSNFKILDHNTKYMDNVQPFDYAISDKFGHHDFYVSSDPENFNGSSSLKKPKEHLKHFTHVSFPSIIKVKTISLDEFCKDLKIDHIDFIFCDSQGAENDIIIGGQNTLRKTKYFYSEFYNTEMYQGQLKLDDWIKLLPGTWELIQKFPNDVLLKNLDYTI